MLSEGSHLILIGAISMGNFIAALFFLKFWRSTRDRFFLFFALSFGTEAIGRLIIGLMEYPDESLPFPYLMRLAAYMLILFAIIDKNLKGRQERR
jgi:hypothetical protein